MSNVLILSWLLNFNRLFKYEFLLYSTYKMILVNQASLN